MPNGGGKPLPRKFLIVQRPSGRYAIMCEINNRTYSAEVPAVVGEHFLSEVFDLFMSLVVQKGLVTPGKRPKT